MKALCLFILIIFFALVSAGCSEDYPNRPSTKKVDAGTTVGTWEANGEYTVYYNPEDKSAKPYSSDNGRWKTIKNQEYSVVADNKGVWLWRCEDGVYIRILDKNTLKKGWVKESEGYYKVP